MLRLPEPMLALAGAIPKSSGWLFEPKLDGFRCLVCTHGDRFRARSRRGWEMTKLLPDLSGALPPDVQLGGELVAFDRNGNPDFHLLCRRMLHGDTTVPVTYMVFDVLACEGLATTMLPYSERRALLDELELRPSPLLQVVQPFEDGQVLFDVICARALEGIVGSGCATRTGRESGCGSRRRTGRRSASKKS